jgi:hypothetical protein
MWLDPLWQVIEDDSVDYLSLVQGQWASCAVPVKLRPTGRTDSSTCSGLPGLTHGQGIMSGEPAPAFPA